MQTVSETQLYAAVLDVNLGGQASYPLADLLLERDIPFVFATGYGSIGLHRFRDIPLPRKAFRQDSLERALSAVLAPSEPQDRNPDASNWQRFRSGTSGTLPSDGRCCAFLRRHVVHHGYENASHSLSR